MVTFTLMSWSLDLHLHMLLMILACCYHIKTLLKVTSEIDNVCKWFKLNKRLDKIYQISIYLLLFTYYFCLFIGIVSTVHVLSTRLLGVLLDALLIIIFSLL